MRTSLAPVPLEAPGTQREVEASEGIGLGLGQGAVAGGGHAHQRVGPKAEQPFERAQQERRLGVVRHHDGDGRDPPTSAAHRATSSSCRCIHQKVDAIAPGGSANSASSQPG